MEEAGVPPGVFRREGRTLSHRSAGPFDAAVRVAYKPGVTDPVGKSAKVAIQDTLGRDLGELGCVDRVWQAILDEPDAWWVSELRCVPGGSKIVFDPRAGGTFVEQNDAGGGLLWFTVIAIEPPEVFDEASDRDVPPEVVADERARRRIAAG